jgi:5-methyltetrahydropteroyltriglutamate--homocysteine methyltransferase
VSVFATGTGIGSWPGTAARPAAEVIVGELGAAMAHLVELPARGVGADIVGRAGALLIDIAIDTVPRGYRVTTRPGAVARRSASLLAEDIDALEEAWEIAGLRGSGRPVKVQAPGPITLAAELELPNGHRAITDLGAFNDIATSLAEGVAAHRASVSRRLDTPVVVQFDEPSLTSAVLGRLTGVTSLSPVAAIEETLATRMLDICAAAAGPDVSVHCCASSIPWKALQDSMISAVSVDAGTLQAADLDAVAEFIESGRVVVLGAVASSTPAHRPGVEEVATSVVSITDRLGFGRSVLRDRIGIAPACGLAAATPDWARTAVGLVRRVAEAFADDPDAI